MERTRILVVSPKSAAELALSLKGILQTAQSPVPEVTEDVLPHDSLTDYSFPTVFEKSQPNIVVVCSHRNTLKTVEEVFGLIRRKGWEVPLLLVAEACEAQDLSDVLKLGAADVVLSPLRPQDVLLRILRLHQPVLEGDLLIRNLKESLGLKQFVGESPALVGEIKKIPKVAQYDTSVLVAGETGTGKEMVARAIHYLGARSSKPFVPVNCGAMPVELIENELFGHESGAFTGATSSVMGLVHEANGGSLFLDEIDCLPLSAQVKLLRFLQDKQYRLLGSRKLCKADVRIIAASNLNFEEAVRLGKLRSDLFYRLDVVRLTLPPLRERKEDIPALARHFLNKYSVEFARAPKAFSPAAMQKLVLHDWPGNVRELQNVIERAVVLSDQSTIRSDDVPLGGSAVDASFKTLKAKTVANFERTYVRELLAANDGNITKAARAAKKNRRAFWELMHKHNICISISPSLPSGK